MPPTTLFAPELRHVNDAPVPGELLRTPRQSAALVREQSQRQAAWLHTSDDDDTGAPTWREVLLWAMAVLLASAAFAMAVWRGPTELQATADTAAQALDARADEWTRAALRANPALTPEQLARVRAAALLIEREGAAQ